MSALHKYNPWGVYTPVTIGARSDVTFVCGVTTLTLRRPDFGNTEKVNVTRAINVSRGGTPNVFRDSVWPEETEISVNFKVLTRAKALEVAAFMVTCLGLLVTYTDSDNRAWEGIITNPETVIVDGGTCKYSAEINMLATVV